MRKVVLPFLLLCLGCSAPADRVAKTAIQPPPAPPSAAEQPAIPTATQEPSFTTDLNELRFWVSPADLKGKGFDQIVTMNIGCVMMIKPECRVDSMRLMFDYYEKSEGRPYLDCIVRNWLRSKPRRAVYRNNWLQIPVCEDAWQWGDLNADGRVDYADFAIYAITYP